MSLEPEWVEQRMGAHRPWAERRGVLLWPVKREKQIRVAGSANDYLRKRRGAKSLRQRRQVSHSWAVPGDSK